MSTQDPIGERIKAEILEEGFNKLKRIRSAMSTTGETIVDPTPLPPTPEIRPFPVPLFTAEAISRALATVPEESKTAILGFTTDGKVLEGAVAARLNDHWSFAALVQHKFTDGWKGETMGTAVVRFKW